MCAICVQVIIVLHIYFELILSIILENCNQQQSQLQTSQMECSLETLTK